MQAITFEEYKSFPKDGFVFFFSMPGFCGLCGQYEKEISKYNVPNLIKVESTNEDELMAEKIPALPCTRIYNNGKVIYEKFGVLYESQIEDLMKFISREV